MQKSVPVVDKNQIPLIPNTPARADNYPITVFVVEDIKATSWGGNGVNSFLLFRWVKNGFILNYRN